MTIKTRRATQGDIPRLLQIEKACFAPPPIRVRGFRDAFKFAQDLVVRERNGSIVAFALWAWSTGGDGPKCCYQRLLLIATDPSERRKGHARALLKRCVTAARGKHDCIGLTTRVSNTAARALFTTNGF